MGLVASESRALQAWDTLRTEGSHRAGKPITSLDGGLSLPLGICLPGLGLTLSTSLGHPRFEIPSGHFPSCRRSVRFRLTAGSQNRHRHEQREAERGEQLCSSHSSPGSSLRFLRSRASEAVTARSSASNRSL